MNLSKTAQEALPLYSNCTNVTITAQEFKTLLVLLNVIRDCFNDFCLTDGIFRARSNNKANIIETGFKCFKDMSFCISDIKASLPIISSLSPNENINVRLDGLSIIFSDDCQRVSVTNGVEGYIDNKFVDHQELETKIISKSLSGNHVLTETLSKDMTTKLKKMSDKLSTNALIISRDRFDPEKGVFIITQNIGAYTNGSNKFYTCQIKNPFNSTFEHDQYFQISKDTLDFNKDSLTLNFYFSHDDGIIYGYHNTKVNHLYVNIYNRAQFSKNSSE